MLQSEAEEARRYAKEFSDRLFRLGSCDYEQAEITCVDVKPQPWGQYMVLNPYAEPITDDQLREIKYRLTESIVKGLIDKGLVQFIVKGGDIPFEPQTIGAKLFVVPWEETVIKIQGGRL